MIPLRVVFLTVRKITLLISRLKEALEDVAKTVKFRRANPKVSLGRGYGSDFLNTFRVGRLCQLARQVDFTAEVPAAALLYLRLQSSVLAEGQE